VRAHTEEGTRAAALSAARAAASRATPAQRERAIAQAAAAVRLGSMHFIKCSSSVTRVTAQNAPCPRAQVARAEAACVQAYAAQRTTAGAAEADAQAGATAAAAPLHAAGEASAAAAGPPREAASYTEPEWSGAPQGCAARKVLHGESIGVLRHSLNGTPDSSACICACGSLGHQCKLESSCRLPSGWERQHWEPCQGNGQGSARRPGKTMPPRAHAEAGTLGRYKQGGIV